ncbi:MAG: tyrosine-type recombinase/integrase, partial [Chloroflexales bacterium]|nr:tyrosine-type recombinase/integrase [Chloroflexales bacterium]
QEHGLIFPSEIGTPLTPRNVVRAFTNTQKEAMRALNKTQEEGEEEKFDTVTIHELRHTCATLLGEREVSDRVIGAILGHAPDNVTQRYARATLAAMREALDGLEALLLEEDK